LEVITGKTIRKAVKTGVLPEPRKRNRIRITDITGVAEITEKVGFKKACILLSSPAAMPAVTPNGTAIAIPPRTRSKLFPNAEKKRGVQIRFPKLLSTGKGPGKIRIEP